LFVFFPLQYDPDILYNHVLHFLKSDIARNELPVCYLLPKQVVLGGAQGMTSDGEYGGMNITAAGSID